MVALSTDRAKCLIAPVRVWVAPKGPVEQIAHLALEFQTEQITQWSILGDTEIFIEIVWTSNVRFVSGRVPQLKGTGIFPPALQQIMVAR